MKNKALILVLLLVLTMTGCSEIKQDSSKDGKYATQNRESSLEYALYMNKQIQVFINEISSRLAIAKNISTGSTADNEAELAAAGLDRLNETYDEVITVYPSTGSDDNREAALTAMKTAIDHLSGYKTAVENGEDVNGYIKDFENDFDQLTGLANLYNK